MRLETKAQIAKTSLSLLLVVVFIFLLGLVVLVVCAGLQINPFRETTTSFLISAFMGLVGVAAVLVLLNVATNISLIADAKVAELKLQPRPELQRKWILLFAAASMVAIAVVLLGTYFSKERYLGIVRRQAEEVAGQNKGSLDEIGRLLSSASPEDFKRIEEIRRFLIARHADLPSLGIIFPGKFGDKTVFYQTNPYPYYDSGTKSADKAYYPCMKNIDCDYLETIFLRGRFCHGAEIYVPRRQFLHLHSRFSPWFTLRLTVPALQRLRKDGFVTFPQPVFPDLHASA